MKFSEKLEILNSKIEDIKRLESFEYLHFAVNFSTAYLYNSCNEFDFSFEAYSSNRDYFGGQRYPEVILRVYFDFDAKKWILTSSYIPKKVNGVLWKDVDFSFDSIVHILVACNEAYENKYNEDLKRQREERNKPKETSPDSLYLIRDTIWNSLKIGRSKNPNARLKQLQIATCNKLELLHVVKNNGHLESALHEKFNDLKINSEWFEYNQNITAYFEELIHNYNSVTI